MYKMATYPSNLAWRIPRTGSHHQPFFFQFVTAALPLITFCVSFQWKTTESPKAVPSPTLPSTPSGLTNNVLMQWLSGQESACQCRRHRRLRFEPWVGKIPRRRKGPQYFCPEIPWTEELGGLQSMGSQRVRHD